MVDARSRAIAASRSLVIASATIICALLTWSHRAFAASVHGWNKSSSIPICATVGPAVPDRTSPVAPSAVEVSGLLGRRIGAHTFGRIMNIDEDVLLAGSRSRPGSHSWIGEHAGKWLHAASLLWLGSQDPALWEKTTRVAKGLIASQGEDGYLGTYVPEKRLGLYPGAAWDGVNWNDSDWDVWVHKYCLIGLLSYYGISGDEEALAACKRAGDLLVSTFPVKRSILIAGTHAGMAPTSVLEPIRRGVLRPFFEAGSWDETRYAVWLKAPDAAAGLSHGTARAGATEDVVFPADAGVVDVSRPPYSVPGDGKTDVTAALQKALDDHPSSNRIIYLPNGTYIISDTLRWPAGSHGGVAQKRVILQGQSRDGTVIRLKDRCRGFGDANAPKAMVWTGKAPAQRFRNSIRNLTFRTGRGNPGAIGVQYIANNQGSLRQVRIVCNEAGPIGLDLGYTDEQGPCLIQDVEVDGFDVGISMRHTVDSITLERIVVRNQRSVGVLNGGQCVSLRGLESINDVPAVKNEGMYSVMTLLDSTLSRREGDSDVAAVENSGVLFARGLETAGYRTAIRNEVGEKTSIPGGQIDEFVSHPPFALFETPKQSLDLPVKETPRVTSSTLVDWVSPLEFGGTADGRDCTEAVQKAVDSGRRVLYFPYGNWRIDGTVQIRGAIHAITALDGRLRGNGKLKVVEGTAPVVTIERMDLLYQQLSIEHASSRPVVIRGVTFGGSLEYTGSGPLFLEDVCVGTVRLGQGQEVWARQLNCEAGDQTKVINDGGTLWIQGLKTEERGTICQTLHGARTEIVGGFIYSNQSVPEGQPMFTVEDAALSATVGESNFSGKPYRIIVRETQDGTQRELLCERALRRGGASVLPLFVARPAE